MKLRDFVTECIEGTCYIGPLEQGEQVSIMALSQVRNMQQMGIREIYLGSWVFPLATPCNYFTILFIWLQQEQKQLHLNIFTEYHVGIGADEGGFPFPL